MPFASDRTEYHLDTQMQYAPRKAEGDTPFCMVVLGDFSGRANRGVCETGQTLAGRMRHLIDIDTLNHLSGRLNTELKLPVGDEGGSCFSIQFSSLEDFHPDSLCGRLEIFQRLLTVRKQLQDPATFPEAATQVRTWLSLPTDNERPVADRREPGLQESNTETIERLLGRAPGAQVGEKPIIDIEALIAEAVRPHIIPSPDPQQAELMAQVEQAISARMLAILHHSGFQELETAWRLLEFLIERVETDETLKIYAIDVSKEELASDMVGVDSMQSTGMYRLLVEQTIGMSAADPYALLVGAYRFDQTAEDIGLLQQLGKVAQVAGAPFLATAHSHFAGCESLAVTPDPNDWHWQPTPEAQNLWQALRQSPEAPYIGLVLPRFLQRLPYGAKTDPIDSFDFEEFSPYAGHAQHVWGYASVLVASLLANAFAQAGWSLTSSLESRIDGLPMFVPEAGEVKQIVGCAEAPLTERAMQILVEKGLIPILAMKGQDAILIPRFQSIASPLAPLAGPWR